jgi:hypothetical protein
MRRSIVFVCLLACLACRKETTVQPATTSSGQTKTTTVAAPPVDLAQKQISEAIPIGPVLIDAKGIGSTLGPDGMVTGEQKSFKLSDPIHLTMKFRESPHGLQASIVAQTNAGTTEFREQKPMNGGKVVTFTIPPKKLRAGHYKVDGYWGGNIAAEYEIDVK